MDLDVCQRCSALPTVTYASARVINIGMRLVCGAFESAPVNALQALSHIPPATILRKLSESAGRRLLKLPRLSQVVQRLPSSRRGGAQALNTPFGTIPTLPRNRATAHMRTPIKYLSSLSHPKGERLSQFVRSNAPGMPRITEHPRFTVDNYGDIIGNDKRKARHIEELNNLYKRMTKDAAPFHPVYFTDGSKAENGFTGSAVIELGHSTAPNEFSFRGGRKTTAYDAEMIALSSAAAKACEWVIEAVNPSPHRRESGIVAEEPERISFFSDCTSALRNITDPGPHPGQVHSLRFLFYLKLIFAVTTNTTIRLGWAPGHSGVIGNIRADKIAKEATSGIRRKHEEPTIAYLKMCSAKRVDKRRSAMHLDRLKGNKFIAHYRRKRSPSNVFRSTDREPFGRVV